MGDTLGTAWGIVSSGWDEVGDRLEYETLASRITEVIRQAEREREQEIVGIIRSQLTEHLAPVADSLIAAIQGKEVMETHSVDGLTSTTTYTVKTPNLYTAAQRVLGDYYGCGEVLGHTIEYVQQAVDAVEQKDA